MTTATMQPATRSVEEQALAIVGERPEEALQLVSSYHERIRKEETALASVRFTDRGIECDNALGLWRMAQMYAASQMIPEHLQGRPHDCMIVMQLSQRMHVDFFMLAQSSYIVHGKPGLEAKLAIALLNQSGCIRGRVRYEFSNHDDRSQKNDAFGCRAIVTDRDTDEVIEGPWIDWKLVKAEGWLSKKGSKWATMPEQMFRYRAAVFLIRTHYPEVMMGMPTVDEIEDVHAAETQPSGIAFDDRPKSDRIADELAERSGGTAITPPVEQGNVADVSDLDPAEETSQETGPPAQEYSERYTELDGLIVSKSNKLGLLDARQELLAARKCVSNTEYSELEEMIAEKLKSAK